MVGDRIREGNMEPIGKCHFLVLEDNEDESFLIKRAFAKARSSATAFLCRNISEAKSYLNGSGIYSCAKSFPKPQAIISDLHLNGEDGFELLSWTQEKAELRKIPFIVLTGSANPVELLRARSLGAAKVIPKPSTLPELTQIIETLSQEWCHVLAY
ncbi:MAG: two-component response regulator [Verrucomicrobiales bacterium]|nr:two-component response regulator [Verrucomicrobiales bacterium]